MKKLFAIALVALMALSASAKPYEQSIGMVAGLGIGVQFKDMVTQHFTVIEEFGYSFCPTQTQGVGGYDGIIDNLVLAYQGKGKEGEGIRLDYYVGGQIKIGYGIGTYGIFGVGAAAGIEANMKNAPIAFSFDFRPGYGCFFTGNGAGHVFDYSVNLGVRYTIPSAKAAKWK